MSKCPTRQLTRPRPRGRDQLAREKANSDLVLARESRVERVRTSEIDARLRQVRVPPAETPESTYQP